MDKSNKSGAEALIHSLHLEGVDLMFGYPGGAALHIYDAIFNQNYVDHILVRHEQGAVHAADGYASCLLYTSPSPRDQRGSRMPSSA